jgi:uncharacterized membrane protein YphA (DoxX/SURF4 family)
MGRIATYIVGSRRELTDVRGWLLRILVALLFVLFSLGKFNADPRGEWFRIFARIGFGQWFRVATGLIELIGGVLFLFPGTARLAAIPLAGTMLGAIIVHLYVVRDVIFAFIPAAFLALVLVVAFRDPSLDDTIANLESRKRQRAAGRG